MNTFSLIATHLGIFAAIAAVLMCGNLVHRIVSRIRRAFPSWWVANRAAASRIKNAV